ncbi:MAG: hypothetical protein A2Y76_14745 [Planctomycetes bacterium RBG_13_60_9]|nr:MAG: hypothetical protein A2Y76_14745 [Planctomycetes bacterium RBG_13_60_9]
MKTLWQHTNGSMYAIEHDSFGRVTGAAGPLDPDDVKDPSEYRCGPGIVKWVKEAIQRQALRRVNLHALR